MRKKILLAGYYGFGNLGDEVLLGIYRARLADRFEVSVLAGRMRWRPWSVIAAIARCDLLLFGGGGALQDRTGSLSLWYYLSLIGLALLLGKDVALLGQGIGPLSRPNKAGVRAVLARAARVTVRDRQSLKVLEGLPARLSADSVLAMEPGNFPKPKTSSGSATILLIPRSLGASDVLWKGFSGSLSAAARRLNAELVVLPLHASSDGKIMEKLRTYLQDQAAFQTWENPRQALEIISRADWVLSARLHGLILASLLEKPFLGLGPDPKIAAWADEFPFAGGRRAFIESPDAEVPSCEAVLEKFWALRGPLTQALKEKIPEMKARALADFEWLKTL